MYANKRTNKRKEQKDGETLRLVFQNNLIHITENRDGYFFEIGNKVFTEDIVEAVSYMMRNNTWRNEDLWQLEIPENAAVDPVKSLYWLSGGDEIWKNPLYNVKWSEFSQKYVHEFSLDVEYALDATTLSDVRQNIIDSLNLDILFEFGLKIGTM